MRVFLSVCLLLTALGVSAQAVQKVPALTQRVTDLADVLGPSEQSALEAKLTLIEQQTGSQLAILIVPTTQPEAIEAYSIRVVDAWKLGRNKVDDGVLLLVATGDRTARIEVGYGLEGALPDARASRIISTILAPQFAAGNYSAGLNAAVDAIAAVIKGEELPLPPQSQSRATPVENLLPIVLIIAVVLGAPLKRVLGLLPGALATGGIAGFVTWLLVGAIGAAVLAGIAGLVVSMLMTGGAGRWSSGGGFGGGGGGFGGGFGGGGGGFGGGGASGRW